MIMSRVKGSVPEVWGLTMLCTLANSFEGPKKVSGMDNLEDAAAAESKEGPVELETDW